MGRIILSGGQDNYWSAWVNKENDLFLKSCPAKIVELYKKSLLILRTNIDQNGAILAGNDSDILHFARDTYSYMWPRDGALTAYALDHGGLSRSHRSIFSISASTSSEGQRIRRVFPAQI